MIDWKSIPKIDAHIHRPPPDVIENNRGNGDRFVEYGSVDDYLRLMDQYHIEAACVMPFNDPYMLSMDFQAGSVHNNLLAMCLQAENCLSVSRISISATRSKRPWNSWKRPWNKKNFWA